MSDIAIRVRGLSKSYTIRHQNSPTESTLTETIMRRLRNPLSGSSSCETFWALKDIDFDIKKGDVVGVIGRNGAGKSTLLKILSRITEPTTGRIELFGRIGSLLEVGTGFHPELTGRENIFLNGAILGMTRSEIKKQFDAIVDFSGVENFLDTPVKRYSSGMYVRLAFAVAAHLNPEILIVDEVLAVGDAEFQKKCLGKMKEVSSAGRTVLFVSHNMAAVQSLCSSAILLQKGQLIDHNSVEKVLDEYFLISKNERGMEWKRASQDRLPPNPSIQSIRLSLEGKQPRLKLMVAVQIESNGANPSVFLAVDIHSLQGDWIMQAIPQVKPFISFDVHNHSLTAQVELPPMIPGVYPVSVWIGRSFCETIDWVREVVEFEIKDSPTHGRTFPHSRDRGYLVPVSYIIEPSSVGSPSVEIL